jgi:lysophospholipase L1-like esterase
MSKAAVALALCALMLAAAAGPARSARTSSHSVYVDGDSLSVGTTLFLSPFLRGWTVRKSTGISRHVDEGVAAIRARGSALEHVVVVDLGTNDDPSRVSSFTKDVRAILNAAGSDRCVIWSTIHRPPYHGISWEGYNKALRRLAGTHDNLRVFEWAALARAHPAWFGKDGVHPNATGYKARAAALARLIKDC